MVLSDQIVSRVMTGLFDIAEHCHMAIRLIKLYQRDENFQDIGSHAEKTIKIIEAKIEGMKRCLGH